MFNKNYVHSALKLASDILGVCHEETAQAIVDAIYNALPEGLSL